MEEEETRYLGGISGDGSFIHEPASGIKGGEGISLGKDISFTGSDEAHICSDDVLSQGADHVTKVMEESNFDSISLEDERKSVCHPPPIKVCPNHSSGLDGVRYAPSEIKPSQYTNYSSSPFSFDHSLFTPAHAILKSPTTASIDSSFYGGAGYSPMCGSPQNPKPKAVMPNLSPELLHLVDSAIMGNIESLVKLKNMVSFPENFGHGYEIDGVAFLIVDSLLATMGGVESFEEDDSNRPPSKMMSSRAAVVAAELIPSLPWVGDSDFFMSPRTRMVRGLLVILRGCTRNRSMCSMAGLLGVLLGSAEKIFSQDVGSTEQMGWDGTPLCYCIQYLAGHSLSVNDLRRLFHVITRTFTTVWATHLMLVLERAVCGRESRGPACTFEFDGETSGLLGPGENYWPFGNGYSFATWIYIESFADTVNVATVAAAIATAASSSGESSAVSGAAAASALAGECSADMPRVFSFIAADNQGIEAYFHAQFLVVESGSGKGKKASVHFTHAFKPQCWYFIGLEHTCKQGLLGKAESELRLYIDGSLYESRPFELNRISKPLAFCCIGTNPPPKMPGLQHRRRQCPLFAEMGPVYIFKESIGPERMARLAARGGDVLPSFGHGAGLPWLSTNEHVQTMTEESALLDADIGGCIHLLYHPSLLSGRSCQDASPCGATGALRRPADVLGQVRVATRMRPVETFWALAYGGPMSLLPLAVTNVNKDSLEPEQGSLPLSLATAALAAPIFRIISVAIQNPKNNEELCRARGPEVLSRILNYLLLNLSSLDVGTHEGVGDEELVAAVVSLCQSEKNNHSLKVHLFRTLLLDLKIWSLCNYGLQKKLLSSLADMVFTESSVMRDANAIQMLLDGCRKCYWTIREKDSVNSFCLKNATRPVGEVNALVDELLVVIELLVGAAPPSVAAEDVHCLLCFMVDCPQPNQVTRMLHLIHRLVVQPNRLRAQTFVEAFIESGGIETLLVLLQREAKAGDSLPVTIAKGDVNNSILKPGRDSGDSVADKSSYDNSESLLNENKKYSEPQSPYTSSSPFTPSRGRMSSAEENLYDRNLGGISFSICADNARNNCYNVEKADGIVVGIIGLLSALVSSGHLKVGSHVSSDTTNSLFSSGLSEEGGTMFDDKVSLLLFALQKVFQAAPNRLMTINVFTALLGASINASSTDDELNLYDSSHCFEYLELLLVLLRSLPHASRALQIKTLQDLLFLACCHPENRSSLTNMEEWPEWILEILISNQETGASKQSNSTSSGDIEDLIHNFLIIMLEHSMRRKDGWKDIEATIHCAEWLFIVGGSSTGDQRVRREEALPRFKRRLLGDLLDFADRELQVQTQLIAATAAGVAAECLSPKDSKAETENAAQLSVFLVENAIVILMLVEDHLRQQSKLVCASHFVEDSTSPSCLVAPISPSSSRVGESMDTIGHNRSSDTDGVPLDDVATMADAKGKISATMMERLAAAAAAEPYESVSCAFVSYGSCAKDLAEGWKYRSRLWYGVGLPSNTDDIGGGGSGLEIWNSMLDKDENGNWIDLPLVNKSVSMLQALLLDEFGLGSGLGLGGGSGTGMGGMAALYQLLDSDQPFLCMLRMVLLSMREDVNVETDLFMRSVSLEDKYASPRKSGNVMSIESSPRFSTRNPRSALLWSVLSPVLNMPVAESKRQRVLVASCILYSEVWHAVSRDRVPLREQYLQAILPPFIAVLRRWGPLLAGIHDLARADGLNPLVVDGRALAVDSMPIEAALAMISPNWAAAFASPPASLALAMIAAGTSGGEVSAPAAPVPTIQLKRETSMLERKKTKLQTFSSFRQPSEGSKSRALPKDKLAAKATALAAARDLERNSKIGTGRGLSAIAMATSAQRRNLSDLGRVRRWNCSEAMSVAWMECLQPVDTKSVYGKDFNALSYKFIAVLVASFALARNMQRLEIDRRVQVDVITRHILSTGVRAWRKLIHCLIDMKCLYGPFKDQLCSSGRVFWKLDFMESSSRMRLLISKNYKLSDHFAAAVANDEDDNEPKHPQESALNPSNIPILPAEAISKETVNEEDEQGDIDHLGVSIDDTEQNSQVEGESSDDTLHVTDPDLVQSPAAVATGYVSSELDEGIVLELPSTMVRPLKVIQGIFQVTTKRINFIVDSNITMDGMDPKSGFRGQAKHRSWLMSSLHQIHSRRYLLRKSALELFMIDRSNFFFDFGNNEGRRDAYQAIVQLHPSHLNNIYLQTQRPEQLLKRLKLMERWARWEISNFEYLIHLNTLAGRSYNDVTQYPVFPWVLSDYSSKNLHLTDPSCYRDLSKPVGALNPSRLEQFKQRYSSFDGTVIPKFHYSSHYSSARTVLYYLIRVEPFTTLSVQLQDGKFDHSDKMFSDIAYTWNAVLHDISDVKELVPEMFYLPEILTNGISKNFGTTQLEKADSVRLPPWADNPVDFIHKHRMALESEHVSENLNHWIDLIFGYKQRGEEAIHANNVFSYITYEGAVNIDKISDSVQRRVTQDQIAYLGQTPSQLLRVPHLKRMPLMEVLHVQTIFRNPRAIKPYAVQNPERCNLPAAAILASTETVIVVDKNAPAARIAVHTWQPNTHDGEGIPFLFQHGKTASPSSGSFARMFKGPGGEADDFLFPQALAFPAPKITGSSVVSITRDGEIITGGHVDNSIKLISPDGAKTLESAIGHCAPVTCVALSPNSCYLVTGSRDTTVLLWRINQAFASHPSNMLEYSSGTETPTSRSNDNVFNILADKRRNRRFEGPIHVLRGHHKEIICCCVNSDLGIVVSSSKSSGLLLHSIRRGRLIRRLAGLEAHAVSISPNGVVMTWNKSRHTLATFTLNGVCIARAQLPFSRSISCMEISADGKSTLIGVNMCKDVEQFDATGEDKKLDVSAPSICFLDLHTLKVLHVFKLGKEQDVVAVALNKENTNLLVSTADKKLIIYTDPEGRNLLSRDEHPLPRNWLSGLTSSLIA